MEQSGTFLPVIPKTFKRVHYYKSGIDTQQVTGNTQQTTGCA